MRVDPKTGTMSQESTLLFVPRIREITAANQRIKAFHFDFDGIVFPAQAQMTFLRATASDDLVLPSSWAEFPAMLARAIGLGLDRFFLSGSTLWYTLFVKMDSTFLTFGEECWEFLWRECRMEDQKPSALFTCIASANPVPGKSDANHKHLKLNFLNWTIRKLQSNNMQLLREPSQKLRSTMLFLLGQKLGCYNEDAGNVADRSETVSLAKLVCEGYDRGQTLRLLCANPSSYGGTDALLIALKEIITADHFRELRFESPEEETDFFNSLCSFSVERLRFLFSHTILGFDSDLEFKSRFTGENYASRCLKLILAARSPPAALNVSDVILLARQIAGRKDSVLIKGRINVFSRLFPDVLDSDSYLVLEAIVEDADSILVPLAARAGAFPKPLNISKLWKLVAAVQRRQTGSENLTKEWILSTMKILWHLLIQDANSLMLCPSEAVEKEMEHIELLFAEYAAVPNEFTVSPSSYNWGVVEREIWARALAAGRAAANIHQKAQPGCNADSASPQDSAL